MSDTANGSGDRLCPECHVSRMRSYQGCCEECFLLQQGWRSAGGNRLAKRMDREDGPTPRKTA